VATFPSSPKPSHVSAPAIIDPLLRYSVDQGYELRRPRTSRPRRRYVVEWAGRADAEYHYSYGMHLIRDFLGTTRNGALPFQFIHPTASDVVTFSNTTPITLTYSHGLVTSQWVYVTNAPTGLNGTWPVTRLDALNLTLNGSTAVGFGQCLVAVYLPYAVARFDNDTWESPTKLVGPEQFDASGARRNGVFAWQLTIEELF
jgi:hypothetical protein